MPMLDVLRNGVVFLEIETYTHILMREVWGILMEALGGTHLNECPHYSLMTCFVLIYLTAVKIYHAIVNYLFNCSLNFLKSLHLNHQPPCFALIPFVTTSGDYFFFSEA